MKSSIRSTTVGLLALTLGALCLADSPKSQASPAQGKWTASGQTAAEGPPPTQVANLPDLVVVPVGGPGYYGFKVSNAGKSPTKSSTTLSFKCLREPKPGAFYEPVRCPITSAAIGPLQPRSSSPVFKITVDSLPGDAPLKHGWKIAATVDEQDAIPEAKENNNIAQWDYVPSPFSSL